MAKSHKIILIVSVAFSLLVIGGAVLVSRQKKDAQTAVSAIVQHPITHAELAKSNGQNGNICYVAVSGTVYQIKDFSLWQDGKHLSSGGLAYCGADLTSVIDQAPHGRKILDILPKVGPLVP